MSRALDIVLGAAIALALFCWALLLVVSGTHKKHNPPDEDDQQ